MALPVPSSLSPSKVGTFKDCALAFRFTAIDRLAEAPTVPAMKGTLVHRALQGLFWNHERGERSAEAAHHEMATVWRDRHDDPEYNELALDEDGERVLLSECNVLVDRYLTLEDPNTVNAVGMELSLEINLDGVLLRGIIDRLDVTDEGEFVVVDYKTGRVPSETFEQSSMGGVQFYALLCEELLGRRPSKVRLLYLRGPLSIEAQPTDQTVRAFRQRTAAVWKAIERACEAEDFRPKPSPLCRWCSFQSLCPAFGGDPSQAASWKKPGLELARTPVVASPALEVVSAV